MALQHDFVPSVNRKMAGKPLQVISVDLESNEVKVNRENLLQIQQNLRDANVEKISVVSVMGAYRTGKSFLLDLFLRYLEYEAENAGLSAASNFEAGLDGAAALAKSQNESDERSTGTSFQLPPWMLAQGNLTETVDNADGTSSPARGFSWRGGASRCTEGMWIWPTPFVKTMSVTENISSSDDEEVFVKRKVKVCAFVATM